MLFETNIDNNLPRISLARAAQLTGYHQDYLGQLCRLGKLEAVKIGRNWFTSPEALNNLSSSPIKVDLEESTEEIQQEEIVDIPETIIAIEENVIRPVIAPNITVNEVQGMPISIRSAPASIRNTNSVQGILTNMRIENLQKEVSQLRELLFRLMEEVKSHTSILQTREMVSRVEDSLKHSYVSNFDFTPPLQREAARAFAREQIEEQEDVQAPPLIWQEPKQQEQYVISQWISVTAVVVVLSFMAYTIASGSFLGASESTVNALYYRDVSPQIQNQPSVAGAETVSTDAEFLPTDTAGELDSVMLR